jgi:hypothetical protein
LALGKSRNDVPGALFFQQDFTYGTLAAGAFPAPAIVSLAADSVYLSYTLSSSGEYDVPFPYQIPHYFLLTEIIFSAIIVNVAKAVKPNTHMWQI